MKKLLFISELGNKVSYSYVALSLKKIIEENYDVYYFCIRNINEKKLIIENNYNMNKVYLLKNMGCLIGIDYGEKRTGLAHTDPNKIIATGLKSILTKDVIKFLRAYFEKVEVERLIIGKPIQRDGKPSNVEEKIKDFIKKIKINFPEVKIDRYDERYTSKIAKNLINESVIKRKIRRDKGIIDKISATLILQSYLEFKKNKL